MKYLKDNSFFCVILLLNFLFAVYFCNQKEAYFSDEGLTYIHSNSSARSPFPQDVYAKACPDRFQIVNDSFTTQAGQRFRYKHIYANLLTHPPLYYFLMHTISSFFPDTFSKWFGLSLNLIFFPLTQIILYHIGLHVFKDKKKSVLTVIFYGFSVPAISTLAFIRAYMLLTMCTLLMCLIFLKYMEGIKQEPAKSYRFLWKVFPVIVAGGLTHYYFFIPAFCACAFVCFFLLYRRNFRPLFAFAGTSLSAVAGCFLIFPPMVWHLKMGDRGFSQSVLPALNSHNIFDVFDLTMLNRTINVDLLFQSVPIDTNLFLFILCLGTVWGAFGFLKDKHCSVAVAFLSFVVVGTSLILTAIIPMNTERYFFHIIPLVIFLPIVLFSDMGQKIIGTKAYYVLLSLIVITCCLNIKTPYFRLYLRTAKESDGKFASSIADKTLLTRWDEGGMAELGLYTFNAKNTIIYMDENDFCYKETIQNTPASKLALLVYRDGDCPEPAGWTSVTKGDICGYFKQEENGGR